MGEQDHRPLAPAAFRYSSSEENGDMSLDESKRDQRRRRGLLCCGCCVATTLVIGLTIMTLALTIFKVKSPKLTFNSMKIKGLDLIRRSQDDPRLGLNMSFTSDMSLKNPNPASFKFTNASTLLFYGDVEIGEVRSPSGNVGAQKTIHMNVTIDVMVDTVTRVSRFTSDLLAGKMPIETYTGIHGRVNVLNILKKHVDVELRCTMTVVISSQTITEKVCKRKVHM